MRREPEAETDQRAQSRIGLKHKLYNLGGSDFDLSQFTESNNEVNRFSSMFPQVNEPTLEDSEPGEHLKIVEDNSLQQYYGEGVTARNSYQKGKLGSSQVLRLQLKIQDLNSQLELQQAQLCKYKKTLEVLQTEVGRLQNQVRAGAQVINAQKQELSVLRQKQSLSSNYSSARSSESKSLLSDSIVDFCPQMLSPDETLELLCQLLKKVGKSTRMVKSIASDPAISQLLTKITKS